MKLPKRDLRKGEIMNKMIADEILNEGIGVLYEKLGSAKTIKFFQLLGVPKGDSVSELREKTKGL